MYRIKKLISVTILFIAICFSLSAVADERGASEHDAECGQHYLQNKLSVIEDHMVHIDKQVMTLQQKMNVSLTEQQIQKFNKQTELLQVQIYQLHQETMPLMLHMMRIKQTMNRLDQKVQSTQLQMLQIQVKKLQKSLDLTP